MVSSGRGIVSSRCRDKTVFPEACRRGGDFSGGIYTIVVISARATAHQQRELAFNTDRNIGATFQTLPGASFVVSGAAPAHDATLTTASAEMKWRNGFSLAGTFEGEFSSVTRSYAGKGVARYAW